jgi:hypothetical protein
VSTLRVRSFSLSLDGYGAGPNQDLKRPVLLGSGEQLFAGLDVAALGYECTKAVAGERATHVLLHRRG